METTDVYSWAFGWCVVQLPLLLLLCVNSPEPHVELLEIAVHNHTATVSQRSVGLAPAYLAVGFGTMVFGMITMQMKKTEAMDAMVDFNNATLQTYATWNLVHWFVFVMWHVLLIAQLTSPCDLYEVAFFAVGQFITIHFMCKPKDLYRGYENMTLVAYFVLALMCYNEMHDRSGLKTGLLAVGAIMDLLLVTGHAYDEQLNTELVGNCRLFYSCCVGAGMVALFFV